MDVMFRSPETFGHIVHIDIGTFFKKQHFNTNPHDMIMFAAVLFNLLLILDCQFLNMLYTPNSPVLSLMSNKTTIICQSLGSIEETGSIFSTERKANYACLWV